MRCKGRVAAELLLLLGFCATSQADVTITKLANAGVVLTSGETRVMIDGMVVEPYSVYGSLPPEAIPSFNQALAEFADIDLALVSHRHQECLACGCLSCLTVCCTVLAGKTSGRVFKLLGDSTC